MYIKSCGVLSRGDGTQCRVSLKTSQELSDAASETKHSVFGRARCEEHKIYEQDEERMRLQEQLQKIPLSHTRFLIIIATAFVGQIFFWLGLASVGVSIFTTLQPKPDHFSSYERIVIGALMMLVAAYLSVPLQSELPVEAEAPPSEAAEPTERPTTDA